MSLVANPGKRTPRVIRFAALTPIPWLNGQGRTTTIVQDPPSEAPDRVRWRVSSAELRGPSTFSDFSGYRRWFAPLTAQPVRVRINGRDHVLGRYDVCTFLGSDRVDCDPGDAAGSDLNLMVRGGAGDMRRLTLAAGEHLGFGAGQITIAVVLEGEAVLEGEGPGPSDTVRLGRLDTLVAYPGRPCTLRAAPGPVTLMRMHVGAATASARERH